jgi:DNA helicase-2/ATP-dependent DNA helicase PcrA
MVTGGPGCGKTTVALRKAWRRIEEGLELGQRVLFLSFSRAAVARILQATREGGLPAEVREALEIQTFHSLCWQLLRGHGYLLGAPRPLRLVAPHDERALRNGVTEEDPVWDEKRELLFLEEGRVVFDLFAPKALALFQKSSAIRRLIASRYPLILVDEAQDSGTDQWGLNEKLAPLAQIICLADLDQQIYDFRRDVSPERLQQIIKALDPVEVDLGTENNRSPGVEIVKFGNDILAGKPRGSGYKGVSRLLFSSKVAQRTAAIRSSIAAVSKAVQESRGGPPRSIGFLTNWGKGVTIIAAALQGGDGAKEIRHRVVMDEAEVLLATRVVALCLEPAIDIWRTLSSGLYLIAELYRARGNVTKANQLRGYAASAAEGKVKGTAKCPKALRAIIEGIRSSPLSGNPVHDWLRVRRLCEAADAEELKLVAREVVYLMAFNRGRRIADSLAEVWQRQSKYVGARALIDASIAEDQILGSDGELIGINVMTMHKSKGKEFDAVIVLHIGNSISPFSAPKEQAPHTKSRRLLRVAVTRAKHHVLLLTDRFDPPELLNGHVLKSPY